MNTIDVVIDIIKSLEISPIPSKQMFSFDPALGGNGLAHKSTGYQVVGNEVIIWHRRNGNLWLQCDGSKVIIIPSTLGATLIGRGIQNRELVVDLANPKSFEDLRNHIQVYGKS